MGSVYDIAAELDRLCPSQVDDSPAGNGERNAGHVGHDREHSIGWSCDGGNVGNVVCVVAPDDIDDILATLRKLPDAGLDQGGLKQALISYDIDWHI